MAVAAHVLRLYRHILKAANYFPSIKRPQVISDIKQEFREHKALTDPARIAKEIAIAERSLDQLQAYLPRNLRTPDQDWEVSLKGPLD